MAFTEALRLLVEADTKGAVANVERLGQAADRELSRSEQSLDRWGNRLTKIGTGLLTFGAVAATGLAMAAQSAGELEQAVGGTEAVFGQARSTIDQYAEHAADSVGLSKTAFRDLTTVAGAQLKNLGFSVDEAAAKSIQLTEIGADLAATYGGTTAEAVEALGAAFRGEADPAERFGLRLNINTANAKAVALGLAESTSSVDDHARAQAILALIMEQSADAQGQFARESDTLAGQQQRLSAQFEDLKAEIGQGAIPVMKTLVGVAGTLAGGFSAVNEATDGAVGKIATVATVGAVATGGLSLLVGQAIKMRDTFATVRDGTQAFAGHLGALKNPAVLAAAAVVAAGVAVDQYNRAQQRVNTERLTNEFVAAGESAKAMNDVLSSMADHGITEAVGAFDNLASSNRVAAERMIEQLEAAGASSDVIDQMRGHLDTLAAAEAQTAADAATATGAIDEQSGAMGEAAGATEDAKSALEEYNDALRAQFDPVFGAISAANGLRDANQQVAEKTAELTEAEREYGVGSAEAAVAAQALSDAQLGAAQAALDQEVALGTLKQSVEDGTTSVDAAKAKLAEWVAQGVITQASADATARELDGVAWSAATIPTGRNINLTTSGVQFVIGQLDDVARRINSLNTNPRIRVSVGGGGGLTLHDGGIVPGPRGQEVAAILQAGERVMSIDEVDASKKALPAMSPAALGGAPWPPAAPTVVNVYVQGSIRSDRDLVKVIRDAAARGDLVGAMP